MKGTYSRDPAPYNVKAQCPVCLRVHKTRRCGTLVRHGWKVDWGLHDGHCQGWGKRPLEQTDEDALAFLPELDRIIERLRGEVAKHETGADSYMFMSESELTGDGPPPGTDKYRWGGMWITPGQFIPDRPDGWVMDWWTKYYGADEWREKAESSRRTVHPSPRVELWWSIKRGDEEREIPRRPDPYTHKHPVTVNVWGRIPGYESRRKEVLDNWRLSLSQAIEQKRRILEAIEHHRNNPKTW